MGNRNKTSDLYNTSKRLPIVFCLDVSPSMGWRIGDNSTSIELLNAAVANFIQELKMDTKARSSAEIAFVTFSTDIESDWDFESISSVRIPQFIPVEEGGTLISRAVLRSIEKIEERREELNDSEIGCYAPFLVLVTDGDPDESDDEDDYRRAVELLKKHCDSHVGVSEIIIPFIIGVGDRIVRQKLNGYAEGFTNGYIPIQGNAADTGIQFSKVFRVIGDSAGNSIHLNGSAAEIINTIRGDMNKLRSDLAAE